MKNQLLINYEKYKKSSRISNSSKKANKFFYGLHELSNIDKKEDFFIKKNYLMYAALFIVLLLAVTITLFVPIKNYYINNKYKNLIYTELSNEKKIKTASAAVIEDNYSYDYLENSLDLLEDKN